MLVSPTSRTTVSVAVGAAFRILRAAGRGSWREFLCEARPRRSAARVDEVSSAEIAVSWSRDGIGRVTVDGEHCASVELSEKRQRWCVEESQGR
jgi:hypothetical protein